MKSRITTFNKKAILLGILPAILLYLFMGIIPSLLTCILSFTDISGVKGVPWKFIGLANYREFFFQQSHRDLFFVLRNTVVFCIFVTVIQNFFALFIALALNSKLIKGKSFFRASVFMPVVLGVLVTSVVWMSVLNPNYGPVAKMLEPFGIHYGFFKQSNVALIWVIFAQIWMSMGYSMVINLAGLQAIPSELYEAGEIDGANRWQGFRYLTLPLLWPTINVNIILAVIGSLQSYQVILLTTGGNNIDTQTLAARVIFYAFNINAGSGAAAMRQGYGATWAMILFIFILIATLLQQRIVKKGEE